MVISSEVDKLELWKKYANQLSHWSVTCRQILLVQPSSTAAECFVLFRFVFFLFFFFVFVFFHFSDQQTSALDDTI